jgi:predicted TIM-barrel fold metal-dependent hydrolase
MSVSVSPVIDCDVHCVPASIAALFPYLDDHWIGFIRNAMLGLPAALDAMYPPGAPTTAGDPARSAGPPPATSLEVLQAQALDHHGVSTAVLSCVTGFDSLRNPYYSADLLRAVNDWQVAEWLDRDPRLRGSILVPNLDPEAAVREIERLGDDPRFVRVLLPVRADAPYGNRRYHPIYAAAVERGLVIALHAWGMAGAQPTPNGFSEHYIEDYAAHTIIAQGHLTSLITEGVFQRFEELRFSLLECGSTWLPAYLWRLDKDWKGIRREVPWVDRRPSELLAERLRLSIEPLHVPQDLHQLDDVLGMFDWASMLMFASDHPHDHGDGAQRFLARLSEAERDAVMGANAAAHYRLGTQATSR